MDKLIIIIEKTNTGFSGYAKNYDGLATVGDTISELKENMQDAINLEIEYLNEMNEDISALQSGVSYLVDLKQFFEHYKMINKTAFAKYIGMNESLFRQYTKGLAPLSDEKMQKITEGLHKLATDIESIVLV